MGLSISIDSSDDDAYLVVSSGSESSVALESEVEVCELDRSRSGEGFDEESLSVHSGVHKFLLSLSEVI